VPSSSRASHPVVDDGHAIDGYRWRLLALVFCATTINYMDRSILTVLAPVLQYQVFHWTDRDFATITMAFQAAYALGLTAMGAMVDRLGTKVGYTISILAWSAFGMLHATIRPAFGWVGFVVARFGLGFAEAGNYPAAVKAVAEHFSARDRGLATGVFNAGSSMGAMLAPMVVPLIVSSDDGRNWPFAFLMTGGLSAVWVVTWWRVYRPPADARGDAPAPRLRWRRVLPLRETWAFAVAKTTDAAWWFYSFWAGKFFYDQYGLDIRRLAVPLVLIFLAADVGSVTGGWASSRLVKRGWTLNRARKTVLVVCAVCALPVALSTRLGTRFEVTPAVRMALAQAPAGSAAVDRLRVIEGIRYASAREFLGAVRTSVGAGIGGATELALVQAARSDSLYWLAVALIALAAAAHQAWSTTIFTIVSDLFPPQAAASVAGIGGTAGACAGIAANYLLGGVLTHSGPSGYFYMFLAAGTSYLLAAGAVHALTPRLTPVDPARLS
jgi:ACS family hexuronate transporter-like MFS transporter